MNFDELCEVAQNIQYEYHKEGDTVFRQGDFGDKFYMILKGRVQVQVPDPSGQGLVIVPKQEIITTIDEEVKEEEDKDRRLTQKEIEALPPKERRRYKTKMMLTDILDSQNVIRSTVGPSQAVSNASRIGSQLQIKVASPSPVRE